MSGIVTDGLDRSPLSSVTVTTVDASGPSATTVTDGRGGYSIPFSTATQVIRFVRPGFITQAHLRSPRDFTLNVLFSRECTVAALLGPTVFIGPDYVDFSWAVTGPDGRSRYPGVTDFLLEVGVLRASEASYFEQDVFSAFTGGGAFYKWRTPGVPPGMYWARFRNKNDCGLGSPSIATPFTWR